MVYNDYTVLRCDVGGFDVFMLLFFLSQLAWQPAACRAISFLSIWCPTFLSDIDIKAVLYNLPYRISTNTSEKEENLLWPQ
jgi:hypothetical protein